MHKAGFYGQSYRLDVQELTAQHADSLNPKYLANLKVEGKTLEFEVDSGTAFTVISEATYRTKVQVRRIQKQCSSAGCKKWYKVQLDGAKPVFNSKIQLSGIHQLLPDKVQKVQWATCSVRNQRTRNTKIFQGTPGTFIMRCCEM